MKRLAMMVVLLGSFSSVMWAQSQILEGFSVELSPSFELPLGSSGAVFGYGGSGAVAFRLGLGNSGARFVPIVGDLIGYSYVPLQIPKTLSVFSDSLLAGVQVKIVGPIFLAARAGAGYFYTIFNDHNISASGGGPIFTGAAGVELLLTPNFAMGLRGEYRYYYGLTQTVAASLGAEVGIGGPKAVPLAGQESAPEGNGDSTGEASTIPGPNIVEPTAVIRTKAIGGEQ